MNDELSDRTAVHRSSFILHRSLAVLLLFLAPRIALLYTRDFFFDELFTHWICAKAFADIVRALRVDSGPPLYYFVIHAIGNPPLIAVRWISLLFAAGALIAILASRRLGESRFLAAALLAVYPPSALFATDARAYALCALFITIAVLALDAHRDWTAALALVVAAYTHYYGVLFFPMLLLRGFAVARPLGEGTPRGRVVASLRGLSPFFAALALFAPWLAIALRQPPQAMAWNSEVTSWWEPLAHFSFAARYPESLFVPLSLSLVFFALALLVMAGAYVNRFAAIAAIPVALLIGGALVGRPLYFPMRFESVLAVPLVLWLATSLHSMRSSFRLVLASLLIVVGGFACYAGIADLARRPVDDYRAAARWVAGHARADELVVANGYLYLETISLRPAIAFPPEQAQHPGWRATLRPGSALPAGTFLWVGERMAPELPVIARTRRIEPLFINRRAMVARVR